MLGDSGGVRFGRRLAVALLGVLGLVACGDDDGPGPSPPRGPGLVQVQTAADLDEAFHDAVAGDTIQILSGFAGTTFNMTHGLELTAEQSPILVYGDSRPAFRPRLVFPDTVDAVTIAGHMTTGARTTTLRYLDVQGGRNGLVLDNATVNVSRCSFTMTLLDGIEASGALSTGKVELCFFELNNRFGISTGSSAALTIERNTVARSGDCGLYIDSNAIVRANNVVQAFQYGIILQSHSTGATLTCNNAFDSTIGPNYVSNSITIDTTKNVEFNPQFCGAGLYTIRSGSPLAALNSPAGCGTIGAFEPECD